MNEAIWAPKAFGGGPLEGDNVTKFVHMDESGISYAEPFCAQAGVIVTADKQWKEVQRRLADLANELPQKYREGFIFHAKDIFQGTDKYYSRERFPNPKDRAAIVRRVAGLAADFELPVFVGFVEKARFPRVLEWKDKRKIAAHFHSLAFHVCVHSIETWMQANTHKDEVAMLFVENNDQSKEMLNIVHRANTSAESAASFKRIVEMPNFVEKQNSSLLQIADACAFSFNRFRRGLDLGDYLMEGFKGQLQAFEYRTS